MYKNNLKKDSWLGVFNATSFRYILRRYFLIESLHPIKRHVESKNNYCVGRSMIEMLGVLAIIAVLTTGGLAGYSKAIQIYKLNKYRESLITLFSNFMLIKEEFIKNGANPNVNYMEIMEALNMVPKEFSVVKNCDWRNLIDMYGHSVRFYYDKSNGNNNFSILYSMSVDKTSFLICQAIVETSIAFSGDIWKIYRRPTSGDDYKFYVAYGNKHCVKNTLCLDTLTVNDIQELCYHYNGRDPSKYSYSFQVIFNK